MSSTTRIYSRQSSQMIDTPTMDYRPIAFMTLMVLTFWLMLSYITDSYFIVFLIFSNFILIFACCISLAGYILRRFIDARSDPSTVLEVSTISGGTPYIVQDAFPPSYEEAMRMGVVSCHVLHGQLEVSSCVICTTHRHLLKETTEQPSQEEATTSTNLPNRDAHTESTNNIQENTSLRLSTQSTSSNNDSVFLPDEQIASTTAGCSSRTSESRSSVCTLSSSSNPFTDELPPAYSEVDFGQARSSAEQNQRQQRKSYRHHKKRPPEPPLHQQNQRNI